MEHGPRNVLRLVELGWRLVPWEDVARTRSVLCGVCELSMIPEPMTVPDAELQIRIP